MNSNKNIVVDTRENLLYLVNHNTLHLLPQHRRQIILNLESLSQQENEKWARKIEKNYFACGCNEGTVFLLLGMILYGFYLVGTIKAGIHLHDIFIGIAFVLFFSFFGKIVGLLLAKVRLKNIVKKILNKI